jgi:hypothetical protein
MHNIYFFCKNKNKKSFDLKIRERKTRIINQIMVSGAIKARSSKTIIISNYIGSTMLNITSTQ